MVKKHKDQHKQKVWLVSVDMGYGHQRAAYPLRHLADKGEIITCNNYKGIPVLDRKIWEQMRKFYEFISRFKKTPIIGKHIWHLYDSLQEIPDFYPKRDLSKMSMQVRQIYTLIEKKNWGRHLFKKLAKDPRPLITTFFIPAFMAEHYKYPGEIFCLTTDSDISRAWAPKHPATSKINYFASSSRVVDRLRLYGVPENKIYFTGFPLPIENYGGLNLSTVKKDLVQRLVNLDPSLKYHTRYKGIVKKYLNISSLPKKSNHPLTVMFAVGGAGAQRETGAILLKSLSKLVENKKIKVVLVAGIHNSLSKYFRQQAIDAGLRDQINKGVEIIYAGNKIDYFKKFNQALRTTDILWTKPSELSFYSALGVPIIIAPPIGSQEHFNRTWLRTIGAAISQENPKYANEWLMDWVESGWFAEAAMEGFIEAPKFGTENIENIINHRFEEVIEPKMLIQF